jgi:septal ring factor EnvC (AmiA/AmiB activator)
VTQVNPNDVATAAALVVQGAIDKLSALEGQPGANIPQIDAQINALSSKQADLRNQVLRTIEDNPTNQAAIAAMNAAAASLKTEAANITNVATAVTSAAKVVTAAASLITTLAPFV